MRVVERGSHFTLLPRRSLQVLATAAVALNPQLTHLTAVVNPDVFLAAQWAAFFYLALLVVIRGRHARAAGRHRGAQRRVVPHARPRHRDPRPRRVRPGRGVVALAPAEPAHRRGVLSAGAVAAAGRRLLRAALRDARLPHRGQRAPVRLLPLAVLPPQAARSWRRPSDPTGRSRDAFIDRFYGTFAQLEVYFSPGVMTLLSRLTMAAIVLALVGLGVRLRSVRARSTALLVLAVFVVGASPTCWTCTSRPTGRWPPARAIR